MGSQVRVLYRAPPENLEAILVSRFFLLLFLRFSLIVSSGRYGLNKLFHPLCAIPLHLIAVPKIFLLFCQLPPVYERRPAVDSIIVYGFFAFRTRTANFSSSPQQSPLRRAL